jgi:hypothetical protein
MIVLKILCLLMCLALVACGGGGGGGSSNPASSAALGVRVIAQTSATQNNKVKNYAVGDLNGDGLDDVVIGGWSGTGTSYFAIMIQNSDGTLTDRTIELLGGNTYPGSMHIFINDFDHDGRADIWLPGADDWVASSNSIMLWGSAGGTFSRQIFTESMASAGACLFDVNNDGNMDMLVQGTYTQGVNTYGYYQNLGNRNFTFVVHQYINGASACAVTRDPNTGHIAAVQSGNNQGATSNAISIVDANLNLIKLIPVPDQDANMAGMIGAVVADVNGDGLSDFITTYEAHTPGDPGRKEVWLNQGADNFVYAYALDTAYNNTGDIINFVYQGIQYYFFNGPNGDATLYRLAGGNLLLHKRDSFLSMARTLGANPDARNWSVFSAAVYRGSGGIYMLQDLNGVYYTQKL